MFNRKLLCGNAKSVVSEILNAVLITPCDTRDSYYHRAGYPIGDGTGEYVADSSLEPKSIGTTQITALMSFDGYEGNPSWTYLSFLGSAVPYSSIKLRFSTYNVDLSLNSIKKRYENTSNFDLISYVEGLGATELHTVTVNLTIEAFY